MTIRKLEATTRDLKRGQIVAIHWRDVVKTSGATSAREAANPSKAITFGKVISAGPKWVKLAVSSWDTGERDVYTIGVPYIDQIVTLSCTQAMDN